jgi:hypothetical protein
MQGSDPLRVVDDHHRFGMSRPTATYLVVGRVCCVTTLVTNCCGVNAVNLPENLLGTPEATEAEVGDLHLCRKGRSEAGAEHRVVVRYGKGLSVPPGKGLVRRNYLSLVACKKHSFTSVESL